MFDALVAGRLKSPVVECEVLQSPPQLASLNLRIQSPEQFVQAVAALSHTSTFWDVADVVHCSARHLPGRTGLPPRAAIRAMRVHRVEFVPVLNEAVPGRIAIQRDFTLPLPPIRRGHDVGLRLQTPVVGHISQPRIGWQLGLQYSGLVPRSRNFSMR